MREKDGKKEYMDDETNEWVSKNELKKRQTTRKKAADAAIGRSISIVWFT